MPMFLAEVFCPKGRVAAFDAAARRASDDAPGVRYAGSIVVPEDETCFLRFEADSVQHVVELGNHAGLSFERVVEALERLPVIRNEGGQS